MGETQNFNNKEAIAKIKELAEDGRICMFTTRLSAAPLASRPMATQEVDKEGNIWFFSKKNSHKNQQIQEDNRVQLLYANDSASEYLSLYGTAEILKDRAKVEKLWSPWAKTWFNEGKEDPTITLLKVKPIEGHYWDTKNNKMVQMIKIAVGAVTGKPLDDGVEGAIRM